MIDVIFMGTPDYAEKILQGLLDEYGINVVAVYTQPDKPVGRKKIITPPEVKILARQNSIDVYQPNRLRDEERVEELLKIECDYIVVAAYGQILPSKVLNHAPCINLHASILPKYRGASPIQQTLLNADKITGVTAMLMEEGLDTGAILKIESVDVDEDIMVEQLFDILTEVAVTLTVDVLKKFERYPPLKQNEDLSSCCKKITKKDGEVRFEDAKDLYNKYRAFTPWPGIYLENGLKIKKMKFHEEDSRNSMAKILEINPDNIIVACKKGSIKIYAVQPQSKKQMNIIDYINGKRLTLEDTLL